MAIRNHLHNKRGQILIESVFLLLMVVTILATFRQLIEFQKSKQSYKFSKNNQELTNAAKTSAQFAK